MILFDFIILKFLCKIENHLTYPLCLYQQQKNSKIILGFKVKNRIFFLFKVVLYQYNSSLGVFIDAVEST